MTKYKKSKKTIISQKKIMKDQTKNKSKYNKKYIEYKNKE